MVLKENQLLNCPPLPELRMAGYSWTGEISQEYWAGCLTRLDSYKGRQTSDGIVELKLDPLQTPPCPEQVAAYLYLLQNSDEIYKSLMQAVFEIYPQMRQEYREGYGYDDDPDDEEKAEFEEEYGGDVPELKRPEELKKVIRLRTIHISSEAKEGFAYIGFELDCNWDEEHGLGVLMHKNRVVKVGQAEASFSCALEGGVVDLNKVYGPPELPELSQELIAANEVDDTTPPENRGILERLMREKGLL